MFMIVIGVILFLAGSIILEIDNKIRKVHLARLQDDANIDNPRALKSLAYRREQSFVLLRFLLLIISFLWLYIVMSNLGFWFALLVSMVAVITLAVFDRTHLLGALAGKFIEPLDKFVRSYEYYLTKISKKIFKKEDDEKIYRPYDDKEFKKLIASLYSSDNLVNKKVLSRIEKLYNLEYTDVEELMTPMQKVKVVQQDDYLGPILLDELHKTGQFIFPVAEEGRIIGSIRLSDLAEHSERSKIQDFTKKEVNYINKDENLQSLLEVFIEYKSEQFLVTDNAENIKGVINIYDILNMLFDQTLEK